MNLKHLSTVVEAALGTHSAESRVTSISYSADDKRLAVATFDRVITIYNDQGDRVDRINTKPKDKGPNTYILTGIAFAPELEHYKLGCAQSDNIVMVYKWTSGSIESSCVWNGKKSICNKFSESCSVVAFEWPKRRPHEVVYGLVDGTVKVGRLKTNKSKTLYKAGSAVVSMSSDPSGKHALSAHLDGSIYAGSIHDASCIKIIQQSSPAYVLAWSDSICAGDETRLTFYDPNGQEEACFDFDETCGEKGTDLGYLSVAAFNESGDAVFVGGFNGFVTLSKAESEWVRSTPTKIENIYGITAISWKGNGSCLSFGTSSGMIESYSVCLSRYLKHNLEITHASPSLVMIQNNNLPDSPIFNIKSRLRFKVRKVILDYANDGFVIVLTEGSMLIQNIDNLQSVLTEVEWRDGGMPEKFLFDYDGTCIVSNSGEQTVVKLGGEDGDILGTFHTEFQDARLISLCGNEAKVAYLLDAQTICYKDLLTDSMTSVNNDSKIDFLELNDTAEFIIFRDVKLTMYLYDVSARSRTILVENCSYAQFAPLSSAVLVAQSLDLLHIWYNIRASNQVATSKLPPEKDVETIENIDGVINIVLDDLSKLPLDRNLIKFAKAIDNGDIKRAASVLRKAEKSEQINSMWKQLMDTAISREDFVVAVECAAAIGDVSRGFYLQSVSRDMKDERESWMGRIKMLHLEKDFRQAEQMYVKDHKIHDLIDFYLDLEQYDEVLRICEQHDPSRVKQNLETYVEKLIGTQQFNKVADIKTEKGEYKDAVKFALRSGLPLKAYTILVESGAMDQTLFDSVVSALTECGEYKEIGELYSLVGRKKESIENFVKGKDYSRAIDIAKTHFPNQVSNLEVAWADHLISINQHGNAIEHYIEAHQSGKAIDAAIVAKRFDDAARIADRLDNTRGLERQLEIIQRHFSDGIS